MAGSSSDKLRFRPRARIIRTIGDQLISGPEAAVIELVKNAYDADASSVTITFTPPLEPSEGTIRIRDDGHGMTLADIQDKWMEPATASKSEQRRSPRLGRRMMGSKGIGRFAAAKLGGEMGLTSISDRTGQRTAILIPRLDWSIFTSDAYLSDIAIDYVSEVTAEPTGTEIEIRRFHDQWSEQKLRKLHTELRRLISPLAEAPSSREGPFRIFLNLRGCTVANCGFDGATITGAPSRPGAIPEVLPLPLLTACDYEVTGGFDDAGSFEGIMQIRRAGQAPVEIDISVPIQGEEDPCGPVGVHLYVFDRDAETLRTHLQDTSGAPVSQKQARQLLDEISGVAIYRDGFRIRPYGDPKHDWLTLDQRRVQDPSLRIGHNQIAGFISVPSQGETLLEERSSREGLEDNGAFARLTRLILTLLAEAVEPRRYAFRQKAGLSRRRDTNFSEIKELSELTTVRRLVTTLPDKDQSRIKKALDREAAALTEKLEAIEERQRVLEAKSSLGAIVGEILHEGSPAALFIAQMSLRVLRLYKDAISYGDKAEAARAEMPDRLSLMHENGAKLQKLFETLRPLAGGKRGRMVHFRPIEPIAGAKSVFAVHGTQILITGGAEAPEVIGHPEDLSTAVVNLFQNSIHWLEQSSTSDPTIRVRLERAARELRIEIEDNGPGIPAEFQDNIFEAGFTLRDRGTGLGLSIAREALARSGAKIAYDPEFEDGARFIISYQL